MEREASGDFDYRCDDPADMDELTSHDDPNDNFWDNRPDVDDDARFNAFNAFNDNTWSFKPAPVPWYRTKQSMAAIVAASTAAAAIVVSGVLLAFRGDGGAANQVTSSVTPTAPTSAAPVQVASSQAAPPELPPPPPQETDASPVNQAPQPNPVVESRPTKAPEFGVTRTPVTRQPLSVAPQPRGGHR